MQGIWPPGISQVAAGWQLYRETAAEGIAAVGGGEILYR